MCGSGGGHQRLEVCQVRMRTRKVRRSRHHLSGNESEVSIRGAGDSRDGGNGACVRLPDVCVYMFFPMSLQNIKEREEKKKKRKRRKWEVT